MSVTVLRMTQTVNAPHEGASALVAREIRAELGRQQLSNRRLAVALGVSFMWVNRRVNTGETALTIEDIQRIADVLGVPVLQLLTGWLGDSPSPNRAGIGASTVLSDTLCDARVIDFPVSSDVLGDGPGAMRATRTVAA